MAQLMWTLLIRMSAARQHRDRFAGLFELDGLVTDVVAKAEVLVDEVAASVGVGPVAEPLEEPDRVVRRFDQAEWFGLDREADDAAGLRNATRRDDGQR